MKKQLLIAAVAATMSAGVFADISIKGDAHFQYANRDFDAGALGGGVVNASSDNATQQRVRLHVTGTSGDTAVKLGLRNDGRTRVSGGAQNSEGARSSGSPAGNAGNATSQFNVDYLYLTTKIGALNIKAGDWWDTTGLGVARKGKADADRIEFSTKLSGWKFGVETGAESSSTVLSASGKIGDFAVTVEHNTESAINGNANAIAADAAAATRAGAGAAAAATRAGATAAAAAAADAAATAAAIGGNQSALDAVHNGSYFDISVKGKVGDIGIAAEYFAGENDTRKTLGLGDDADAYVVHLWTKLNDITWHVAYANSEEGVAGITGSGNKFSPLGVSILGNAVAVGGNGAIGNFGNAGSEDTVFGVRADLKLAGMGVQVAAGDLEIDAADLDGTFWDIIVTRPLGKGSNIKFSAGEYEDVTSLAAKISVKF